MSDFEVLNKLIGDRYSIAEMKDILSRKKPDEKEIEFNYRTRRFSGRIEFRFSGDVVKFKKEKLNKIAKLSGRTAETIKKSLDAWRPDGTVYGVRNVVLSMQGKPQTQKSEMREPIEITLTDCWLPK